MQNRQPISYLPVTEEQRTLIERFQVAFNNIDAYLRKFSRKDRTTPFATILNEGGQYKLSSLDFEFMKQMAELRNVIVHEHKGIDRFLSVPVTGVVERLERICNDLLNPVKVIPKFQRPVMVFSSANTLHDVLDVISEKEYSQFPIQDAGLFKGLLTENGITRGLARYTREIDSIIEFKETPVRLLLREEEKRKNYQFIRSDLSLIEAQQLFVQNPELEALLITQNGKVSEALLGIITHWDILNM